MQQIKTILTNIEQTKKVQILYACETGSRAWGVSSPDSDYDVRFIYRHERDWYLSLSQHKDTIEYMVDETWDVTGWDLRKSLLLLKKSNAALIERFQSPTVYSEAGNFKDEFKQLIETYYSPTAGRRLPRTVFVGLTKAVAITNELLQFAKIKTIK